MATAIEAYCDESGIHDGAAKCVVVGWVAAARHWEQFEERWRRASRGVDFHGKRFFARDDFGQRVKPYEGWDDDEARAYLLRLVQVITTSSVKPIGAVVDVKDFQARTESERKWLTGATYSPEFRKWEDSGSPNRPYYLAFNQCIESAAACVKNPKWKVSFYFDQQNVLAPYALDYFKRAKVLAPPRLANLLGDIAFKSSAGVGALQAADMLAHACYRRAATPVGKREELDIVTVRLRPITHRCVYHYHKQTIEERLAFVDPEWRKEWRA